MCDAAMFIKIEAAAAAKSTALGRAAKRPYKSPNAACPTGWVRQAQTYRLAAQRAGDERFYKVKTAQNAAALRPVPFGQYRIILSADTASEVRQLLSQKHR